MTLPEFKYLYFSVHRIQEAKGPRFSRKNSYLNTTVVSSQTSNAPDEQQLASYKIYKFSVSQCPFSIPSLHQNPARLFPRRSLFPTQRRSSYQERAAFQRLAMNSADCHLSGGSAGKPSTPSTPLCQQGLRCCLCQVQDQAAHAESLIPAQVQNNQVTGFSREAKQQEHCQLSRPGHN